jgi:uncharacterized protein with GYD domain
MPLYLIRARQTPETWQRMIDNPEDRRIVSKQNEHVHDGKFHGMWYGFGDYDVYALIESPNNVAAAGFLAKQRAAGAFSEVSTVCLMSVDEMLQALERAKRIDYAPPGGVQTAPSS